MLKILYISPENTVGVLTYWQRAHRLMGNECRYVTFFKSASGYSDDILLNLPLVAAKPWFLKSRLFFTRHVERLIPWEDIGGNPPIWNPPKWEKTLFKLREKLWQPKIEKAIKEYHLEDFNIYHFEWGSDFYRDARFAKKMKKRGKKIICHYHGQDMRNRGVIPEIDAISDLNLTSELDLTFRHPNLKYIFLPFDVKAFEMKEKLSEPITICHATTNRYIKGSNEIIKICKELEKSHNIRFILIERQPHSVTMELKRQSDIYVDQISDHAWGYGMNSLEALSMGIVCATYLNPTYQNFIPDHPFINVTPSTLKEKLITLIENPDIIREKSIESRKWVEKYHDFKNAIKTLYKYYQSIGISIP